MADFEKSVIEHLKSSGLDKARLGELAASAAQINASGLKNARIFTRGIPIPDWIRISGLADKTAAAKLLAEILVQTKGLGGIHVFPYGIPKPDIFHVNIDIGPGSPGH